MAHILVVDDLADGRYLLETLLTGDGHTVETAVHGRAALDKAHRRVPDLVISDILMPVVDGFELCRRWKADDQLKAVPFIFYTATYTDEQDAKLAADLGADRFIVKPQHPREFLTVIRDVLAEHAAGALTPAAAPARDEGVLLREYNEALVRKLEARAEQLEEAQRALAQSAREIETQRDRLRLLTRRLLSVQEDERVALARELHDGAAQDLVAVRMLLAGLGRRESDGDRIARITQLVEQAGDRIRDLAVELRPSLTNGEGMAGALRRQMEARCRAADLALEFADDARWPPAGSLADRSVDRAFMACYRIALEAVTNTARHAGATTVRVALRLEDGELTLEVVDDGRGFDPAAEPIGRVALGLLGMEEQARAAAGTLSIRTAAGRGTTVIATIPVRVEPGEDEVDEVEVDRLD